MRAIVVTNAEMSLAEVPDPSPREGDLIVRIHAAGVNRADLLQRLGRYAPPPGEPETIGLEVAGEVERAGGAFKEGDRVMALLAGGGYAEKTRVPAAQAMPIPRGMSFEEAAAIPEAFLTAYLNLFMIAGIQKDQAAIVHAGASGIGSAALQLLKGVARVILATASAPKLEKCRELGATHVLAREKVSETLAQVIQSINNGKGADVILDTIGGAYLEANVAALGLHGRLACISTMSGAKGTLDLGAMLTRRLSVLGSTLRSRTAAQKAKLVKKFSETSLARFESGELRPVLARTLALSDAQLAHDALQAGEVVGKIVLVPSMRRTIAPKE